MAMVCPQCGSSSEQRLHCPRCDTRLNYHEGNEPASRLPRSSWQQTPWGRIIIGLVLSQGMYHGMRHLFSAAILAAQPAEKQQVWESSGGFLLLLSMQLVSLFVGGLLAGAAQRNSLVHGLVLGIWNGVLALLAQPDIPSDFNSFFSYGLPGLHALVGALSAWLGSRIWQPMTPTATPGASRQVLKSVKRDQTRLFVGPVYWVRVVLGTLVGVAGALCAGLLLDRMILMTDYALSPGEHIQAEVVTWEIVALSIFMGGCLAGANTRNGLVQGLAVGVSTAILLVGIRLASPNPPSFLILSTSMFGPVILGLLGGCFGGKLFPPILVVK